MVKSFFNKATSSSKRRSSSFFLLIIFSIKSSSAIIEMIISCLISIFLPSVVNSRIELDLLLFISESNSLV